MDTDNKESHFYMSTETADKFVYNMCAYISTLLQTSLVAAKLKRRQ